jgi:hypothetical protein
MALTTGPGQEEFASFEPASTTDMVDLYTGDYNYNIPLLSVPGPNGGYPINMAYHSGIGMEQEASWVGLGWNLNVGSISRGLRGLPDDFYGDNIKKTTHVKDVVTASLDVPTGSTYSELIGFPIPEDGDESSVTHGLQLYYNNYKGLGTKYSIGTNIGSSPFGLRLSSDSQNGLGIGLVMNAGTKFKGSSFGFSAGLDYNSRQGLQSFNFSASYGTGVAFKDNKPDPNGVTAESSGEVGGKSSMSFATVFGVPKVNMEMKSTSVPFMLRLGSATPIFRFSTSVPLTGSVYTSKAVNGGVSNVPGQGYLYTNGNHHAAKDFTRKEVSYSKNIPHLGSSSFTYDLYTQTGQGTGSMFRPHLNTFGVLTDPYKLSSDRVRGLGLEVGFQAGFDLHVGLDINYGDGSNSSGKWVQNKDKDDWGSGLNALINWNSANGRVDYEPYYFKVFGEKTGHPVAEDQLNNFGGDRPIRFRVEKEKHDKNWLNRHYKVNDELTETETGSTVATMNTSMQTKQQPGQRRAIRATSIEALTNGEAAQFGFSRKLKYYNASGVVTNKTFTKPAKHISEISTLQPDGMRYVYGLAAYNNKQVENLFALEGQDIGLSANPGDAIIHQGGTEIGGINVGGSYDQFVSKTELPGYAHTWMLTSVLSADYLDCTNDGPTDDDFGYWVKFNYQKVYDNYAWRAPYSKANYLDGNKTDSYDNKGSYVYGEKEIYIIKSIETKTHIAVFETSARKDTYESAGEYTNGYVNEGRGTRTLKKLDKIKLYTKKEYAMSSPVPTKVINFEYSYDLCGNVPNNDGTPVDVHGNPPGAYPNVNSKKGKLTLTKLYFTYQNSTRGKLSPYTFNYGVVSSQQDNPDYNKVAMDRWGNYRKVSAYGAGYPYVEHPYTDQESSSYGGGSGMKAAPWTLKEVNLPTGGTLKIEYDFDDYAYVEGQQATRMYDICGMSRPTSGDNISTSTLNANSPRNVTVHNEIATESGSHDGGRDRIYIKLENGDLTQNLTSLGYSSTYISGLSSTQKDEWFRKLYLENLGGYVYFSVYTNLKESYYDYVKGYAEIDFGRAYGIDPSGAYGYFSLKNQKLATPVNTLGMWVSPFTRGSIDHLRANRSELVYNAMPYSGTSVGAQIMGLFGSLVTQLDDLMATVIGFNNFAYEKDWCQKIKLNGYSVVRLGDPNYKKIGGGVRVKKLTLNDNWRNNPSIPATSIYGQKYNYTTTAMINGKESVISSGVSYEPQVGGDENAMRMPIPYTNSVLLHGSYSLFMEKPIMDDHYPGAGVGYSKVTVESIAPEQALADNPSNPLQSSGAPLTISEFYTPKDFPVVFDKTDMNPGQPIKVPLMIPGLLTSNKTHQAKSQGYSIILNDMAGKPKAVTTKTLAGQVLSRQRFEYNTEAPYAEGVINKLSSKVQTLEIDPVSNEAKYITSIVGQTHDMYVDMNEDASEMESFNLQLNLDVHYTPPAALIFMIMPIPSVQLDQASMRTIVFNKVISRTGIVKKIETTTNQSTITTENLAFDKETGEALLTKVTNEFKDPLYNFNYPGHWYYHNMQGAHKNFKLEIDPPGSTVYTADAFGYIPLNTPFDALNGRPVSDFFSKGDQVLIDCASGYDTYDGEYHVFNFNNNKILLMNSLGLLFNPGVKVSSIKVIHSGFKNMQNAKVGALAFKENPNFVDHLPGSAPTALTTLDLANGVMDNKIINSSAIEYSNDWQVFCGDVPEPTSEVICTEPSPLFDDFMNMIQTLYVNGKRISETQIYSEATNAFSYGFTSPLLYSNGFMADAVGLTGNQILYYDGDMGGSPSLINGFTVTFTVDPGDDAGCRIYFRTDDPNMIWNNLTSYSSAILLSYSPTNSIGAPDYETYLMQGTLLDGTVVTFEILMPKNSGPSCVGEGELPWAKGCCWDFAPFCYTEVTPNYACGIQQGEPINPYLAGMKGMWRPKASYIYNTLRTQNNNIREDGIYTDFVRFPWEDPSLKSAKWITAKTITKYSPHGFELENLSALGNYTSAVYGYKQSLVTAIGTNAKYNEIAFDNFEDYPLECNDKHFRFEAFTSTVSDVTAHSGKYSIKVASGAASATTSYAVENPTCIYAPIDDKVVPTPRLDLAPPVAGKKCAHLVNCGDCLGTFAPIPGKKYVASVWVKESVAYGPVLASTNYTSAELRITIAVSAGPSVVYNFIPKGNIIDGWQQIFENFDMPSNATGITVDLVNNNTMRHSYFDDIRIHPFTSGMKSFVYDHITFKPVAELDANNFATFYNYDDEGHLMKIKRETTQGIKTIKEGRINNKK